MRVLITGITGFVGSYLAEFCLGQGAEVWGVQRVRSCLDNIVHILPRLKMVTGDLTDPASVRHVLEQSRPDWVFNLAAQSFVGASFTQPRETMDTNIDTQINLLHGLREKLFGRMLSVGSSEEYGLVAPDDLPITEDTPLRPLSPYGVSKVATDLLAYQYHQSYGVNVVRSRAFNHEGPRRGEQFVTSAMAKQIAEIEAGLKPPVLFVGNLDATRDYLDVRDVVRAYWLLMDGGRAGEVYNICSGKAWSIGEVVHFLTERSTVPDIRLEQDPARLRPSDVPRLLGSAKKLMGDTAWTQTIPFRETLVDILAYWRRKILDKTRIAV